MNITAPNIFTPAKLAVVITEENVFVSPIRNDPDVGAGSEVTLQRTSPIAGCDRRTWRRDKRWIWTQGLSLDGPGGDE